MRFGAATFPVRGFGLGLALFAWAACGLAGEQESPIRSGPMFTAQEEREILRFSPLPPVPPDPTNAVADDPRAARFGQFLFFDERLSGSGEHSCATCHRPEHGFADDQPLTPGMGPATRHTQGLLYAGYHRWYLWDGRADSLWAQALGPIENPDELGFSRLEVAHLIHGDDDLRRAYVDIFGELPELEDVQRFPLSGRPITDDTEHDEHVAWSSMTVTDQTAVNTVFANVGKALAAYQRLLVPGPAPIDTYVEGLRTGDSGKRDALSPAAERGLKLFVGRGNCVLCHSGPLMTDLEFHNLALGDRDWLTPGDRGRSEGIERIYADPFTGGGAFSDAPDSEEGRQVARIAIDPEEQPGQFKTPVLRNVAQTPPYMHGGHFASLEEVVRFYSEIDEQPSQLIGHRDELLFPLSLNEQQIKHLVAFLESLTGSPLPEELLVQPSRPYLPEEP